jgi:hypothetical protein
MCFAEKEKAPPSGGAFFCVITQLEHAHLALRHSIGLTTARCALQQRHAL